MNTRYRFSPNASSGLAAAVLALIVIPATAAQTHVQPSVQPYYDAARGVMVTPVPTSSSPVLSSPGAVHPIEYARAPQMVPHYTQPAASTVRRGYTSPMQSSPGAVIPPRAAGSFAQRSDPYSRPYYDARRDVVVTPRYSNPVRAGVAGHRVAAPSKSANLVVRRGQLVQGPTRLAVVHGSKVTLAVESDLADSLRVDGYDLAVPIMPGQPVLLSFLAERPGRFAYRLGRTGREIGVLEVGPPRPMAVSMR